MDDFNWEISTSLSKDRLLDIQRFKNILQMILTW